jgi:two-component system, chemotaxis family, protein-glutamate methylesterase/glutaminase
MMSVDPSAPRERFPIIALVGSVGALDAVSTILTGLPATLAASLIVLIHQPPARPVGLERLLSRRSMLPVRAAEDGAPLRPGEVIVVPPGRHLLVTPDLGVALVESGAAPPSRPSADLLLATLATAAGPRALAVVLSGGGHDGATGALAMHGLGGTVLASDEATSAAFSMPGAAIARDDAVDHVLPLTDIAAALTRIVAARSHGGGAPLTATAADA